MTMAEAIISGNLEAVKKIQLENPSCIDELYNGITLPNLAASTGNTEIFKYIVEYSRASFNETDDDNRTVAEKMQKFFEVADGENPSWNV